MSINDIRKQVEHLKKHNHQGQEDGLTIWERIDLSERILKSDTYQRYKRLRSTGRDKEANKILETLPMVEREHYQHLYVFEVSYLDNL